MREDSGLSLPDRVDGADNSCPSCGATTRSVPVQIDERIAAYDSVSTKVKRPSVSSAKKVRAETFDGVEHSHKYGKLVRKTKVIDRDADVYIEQVTDIESGEILHECVEPLTQHRGHGTAKPTK